MLHVSPESYVGGPLALVRNGDVIELSVTERKLELRVDPAEIARRRAEWRPEPPRYERGFGALYSAHVTQAHLGCDFDFMQAGGETQEPAIH